MNGRFVGRVTTGVERYASSLLAALERVAPEVRLDAIRPPAGRDHGVPGQLWEQTSLAWQARGRPLLSLCNFGPVLHRRHIVAIHDAAPFRFPETFPGSHVKAVQALQPQLARRAARLVTVSPRSRDDLVSALGVPADRITVVPNGVDVDFWERHAGDASPHPRPYALFVGAHDPRKNLDLLTQVWGDDALAPDLDLVVTSRSRDEAPGIDRGQVTSRFTWVRDPSDAELATLYRHARVLVFPSHYEGFGLPLLEALAVGTPVLTTDVGIASDLIPQAAELGSRVLPPDAAAWAEAIAAVSDQPVRHEAPRWLRQDWSWDASARTLLELIRDV